MTTVDPSRSLTLQEAQTFDQETTFVAILWRKIIGFLYLRVELDPLGSNDQVGAIGGIGILARYRRRHIGLKLMKFAIEHFSDKNVEKLVCEVVHRDDRSSQCLS